LGICRSTAFEPSSSLARAAHELASAYGIRGEEQPVNIWGWLVVLGTVGASVGFILYGMGTSTLLPDDQLISSGRFLMIGGLIALAVGFVAYKATERSGRT
jgi:hypothetical protein